MCALGISGSFPPPNGEYSAGARLWHREAAATTIYRYSPGFASSLRIPAFRIIGFFVGNADHSANAGARPLRLRCTAIETVSPPGVLARSVVYLERRVNARPGFRQIFGPHRRQKLHLGIGGEKPRFGERRNL